MPVAATRISTVSGRQEAGGMRDTGCEGHTGVRIYLYPPRIRIPPPHSRVQFTNSTRFWPEERYTKSDLIEYYRAISQ